jgi:hypothetical protein
MRTVRIPPVNGDRAIPDPDDVFDALLPEAAALVWALSDAEWVVAKEGSPLNVDLLQGDVAAGPSGLVLSWAELRGLLDNVLQVIDGTFVACHDQESIPPRSALHEELVGKAEMVVTAFDSSYWLVTAPDPVVVRLIDRFPGTETVY